MLLKNTSTPRWFETSDEHHACNRPLSYTLQCNTKVPWQFNTQCTKGFQQIKTTGLEEEILPLLARASRQTSMLTPNNTSEALLSSCTWKNISSTRMKTHLLGKLKQGYGDNAYTKERTWRKQKASESSFLWIVATLLWNKLMKKKTTSSQPSSWDGRDLACWWINNCCHHYLPRP